MPTLPRPALLLIALLAGCAEPPVRGPPPTLTPLGARALRLHDGLPLLHYGPERTPVVRIEGAPDDCTLRIANRPLPTRVERLGAHVFLVSDAPGIQPPPGPTTLAVTRGAEVLAEWTVWWSPPGEGLSDAVSSAIEAMARALGRHGLGAAEIEGWRALAALDEGLGRPTEAARALRIAAQRARQRGQLTRARDLIRSGAALDASVGAAAGRAYGAYARAGLELVAGELRAAEAAATETVRLAEAAWRPSLARYGTALRAVIGSALGHHADARATLEAMLPHADSMSPDLRLMFEGNRGWVLMEGHRKGAFEVDPARIEAAFTTALAAAAGRPDEQANQHANLAALARMTGDRAAMDRHIAAHDRLDPERQQDPGLFVGLLDGHRALLDGDGQAALARFEAVERRLRTRVSDPVGAYLWQARLGQARAHRRLGDGAAALVAYRDALAIIDRAAGRTALQGQRALFFAEQDAVFDEAFAAALAEGDPRAAFAVADAARARVVRDLEVRTRLGRLDPAEHAEWSRHVERYVELRAAYERERTAGELMAADRRARWLDARRSRRAALQSAFDAAHDWLDRIAPVSPGGADVSAVRAKLGPDEALWLAHRHADRWHGFQVTPHGFEHRIGDTPLPGRLPPAIAHLALVGVPPAAAPALWDRVSTAVWTHAGALRPPAGPADGPRVVLGDPDQSLPGARREARQIADQLGARLLSGPAVDRAAVRDALATAAAVHFAGHGVLVPASPWDAHLRLADGQRLTTEDVLMAPVKPRLVVLSSCETGRAAPLSARIDLSLADALVAAGAGSVVAAERPVPDAAAAELMRRFYAEGGLDHPAEALRRAALAAREAGDPQWDAFHLRGAR